jgi:hypothetical protein
MATLPESWWAWFRGEKPVETDKSRGLRPWDRDNFRYWRGPLDFGPLDFAPSEDPRPPVPSSQTRLAEIEQLLADFARSEGRPPTGSVKQQVQALIDRLDEQDKQSI